MKKIIFAVLALGLLLSVAHAIDFVTVGGKTYVCENRCSVESGPPATIDDSEGGYWGEVHIPEAAEI